MADKLTIKQEKFCQGLFAGLKQREAYIQAYNCEKMKDATIDRNAHELVKSSKIATRIQELTNELKDRNMITVEEILAEYKKIGKSDIKDYLEYRTEKAQVDTTDDGIPIYEYRQIVNTKPSKDVDGTLISEVSIGRDGTFKFKLHDKLNALEKMGKHLGMFIDKSEISVKEMPEIIVKRAE